MTNSNQFIFYKKSTFLKNIAVLLIIFIIFLTLPSYCASHSHNNDHDHDHDHHDVPPSFKYSKEANENFVKQQSHEHHHHHQHDKDHHHQHHGHVHDSDTPPLDMFNIWLHSIGSTLLISAAPYLILYAIPLDNTEKMKPRLKIVLAFASGGLLGDAFLHLIPHAIVPHSHHDHSSSHEHNHDHSSNEHNHEHSGHDMSVGLWVLSGIITFLAVEKSVRLIRGDHGHSHNSKPATTEKSETNKSNENKDAKHSKKKNKETVKDKKHKNADNEVAIAGYLNLAADFTHNFTDGLAIGASYLAGNSIGIVTTITILLHEVPHEIGDFAILVKSGCSKGKAMMLQLVTAVGALAGTTLALIGAGNDAASLWVLPFTAGGFIYIATVSVLPELLEESTKLGQSLKEISALLAGVGLMVIIANFE